MRVVEVIKLDQTSKQMLYLFLGSFSILFAGMGLFPLLPLYLAQFGATPTFIGIFYSLIYVANAVGPLSSGWLVERIPHRTLFIIGGVLGVPTLVLMGLATALWQIVILSAFIWFLGGMNMALISIYAGACSNRNRRGSVFSLMTLAIPLGTLAGAFAIGQIASVSGFGPAFMLLALVWGALPLIGVYGLRSMHIDAPMRRRGRLQGSQERVALGRPFILLAVLTLVSLTTINMARLGTTLSMQGLDYTAREIASAATISGLVSIPITLSAGILSDRLGRKRFLVTSYILASLGSLTLGLAAELWQFWLAASLMMIGYSINRAMASALASDVLAKDSLSRGLSIMNTVNSTASILSFAWVGFLIERVGPQAVFLVISAVPALALVGLRGLATQPSENVITEVPVQAPREVPSFSKNTEVQSELIKSCM